jgi:hypothetical protein
VLHKEHADPLDDFHRHLSRKSANTSSWASRALLATSRQPLGSSQQGIERSVFLVAQVASVVSRDLDHLTIGNPSLLTDSGAPLWGKPVWGKGKEERGTGKLGSYRK